jgi:hypothetical protein
MVAEAAHGPTREADQWANLTRTAQRLGWPRERLRSLARRGRLQTRRTNTGELLILLTPELVAQAQAAPGPAPRPTHRPAYRSNAADPEADLEASPVADPWAGRMAELEDCVAGLQVDLAKATAERDAARAVAVADVNAAKMVAEAEIAAAKAEAAAKDQVIAELKAMLAEARRPWWRRWLG